MNRTPSLYRACVLVALCAVFTSAQAPSAQEPSEPAVLDLERSERYGQYVTDGKGRALYLFVKDKSAGGSTCYDACARAWPPLLTSGEPKTADPALKSELVGHVVRKDGTRQVTYGGWPLYYYVKDRGKGETTGQDVKGFGAEWYLIAPSGEKVEGQKGG